MPANVRNDERESGIAVGPVDAPLLTCKEDIKPVQLLNGKTENNTPRGSPTNVGTRCGSSGACTYGNAANTC